MRRHIIHEAFVLRIRQQGEKNAGLLLLTRTAAQIWVQAFGMQSSRSTLRAVCQPFNQIRAYINHDPVKQFDRIVDAESIKDALDLRTNMNSIYLVSYFSELFERSPLEPGEEWPFMLMMDLLAAASTPGFDAECCRKLFCLGLWKYLDFNGFADEFEQVLKTGRMADLPAGVVNYLRYSGGLPLTQGLAVGFDSPVLRMLGLIMNAQVESLLGYQLRNFSALQVFGF